MVVKCAGWVSVKMVIKLTNKQLKEKLERERAMLKKKDKEMKEKIERKELKRQLRAIQKEKFLKSGTVTGAKTFIKGVDKFTQGMVAADDARNFNIKPGEKVVITNGSYAGTVMQVRSLIPGGIQGVINGNIIKIRHGSYKK